MTGGLFLRIWCYLTLDKLFTFNLGIRENHQLIKNGPYKILIHPSATGQIVTILSTLVLMNVNWILLLLIFMYIIERLIKRIKIEERMMYREFGDKYIKYRSKRYRLIPYLL